MTERMTESEAIIVLQQNIDLPFGGNISDEISEMAIKALEKQIAKKPIFTEDKQFALCPCCDTKGLSDKQKYCSDCGQAIDWSDKNGTGDK